LERYRRMWGTSDKERKKMGNILSAIVRKKRARIAPERNKRTRVWDLGNQNENRETICEEGGRQDDAFERGRGF